MTYCNLASCPSPTTCLGSGDPQGCSPVANLDLGERIVYELYDTPPTTPAEIPSGVALGRGVEWWVIVVVVFVVLSIAIGGAVFGYYYYRKMRLVEETI